MCSKFKHNKIPFDREIKQDMPLILRVDVDKPYGRKNLVEKVLSRMREDYWFPVIPSLRYLYDLKEFLLFLDEERIDAHIYFRMNTLAPQSWFKRALFKGHKIGFHAEDTRSFETFKKELEDFQKCLGNIKVNSFTKHGSGKWKGGRNHYPPYEPEKYLKWAEILGVPFLFGNKEEFNYPCQKSGQNLFYPGAFWIERHSEKQNYSHLQNILNIARERNLVVLIHSGSFEEDEMVKIRMRLLVSIAREVNVPWITL